MPKERYLRQRAYRERERGNDFRMGDRHYYPEYDNRYDSKNRPYNIRNENYDRPNEQSREYARDYGYDMREDYRRRNYDMNYDYDTRRDYRRDMRDYSDYDYDKDYHKDLDKWIEKLKRFDRFNLPKDQVLQVAKQMGVEFKDYDEEEFYAIYLMHLSDYPTVSNDSRMYLNMAKSWLEDKDIKIEPSEKVCKYMYEIAMAEE